MAATLADVRTHPGDLVRVYVLFLSKCRLSKASVHLPWRDLPFPDLITTFLLSNYMQCMK